MSRQVNQTQPYADKLVKFIPSEIIASYMVISGILGFSADVATTHDESAILGIKIVFFVLLALTPLYLWKVSKVTSIPQMILSTVSFAIWVYTLGGPFSSAVWNIYNGNYASIILILWTLIVPIFFK